MCYLKTLRPSVAPLLRLVGELRVGDLRVGEMRIYHTSNSCKCMGVNGESLQLQAVYKKRYFLLQVTRESISVQVT